MTIETWLRGIGMERYAEVFVANAIDDDMLARLTSEDLKDIGIAALGHRKRILDAIAATLPTPALLSAAERRQLTVLFVDLVGSTALSARLDPEDMRELIRSYQNTVAGEITRYEGHIAQFLGDGVLAYFGWPRAHEDEAERAVRSALAVAVAIARLRPPGADALQTRCGIATGVVVVGDLIGEGIGQRHAVVGETPNLAARLQALAEPGAVVIAETTRHLLGDLFALRELGPQTIKGLPTPVTAHAVLGERPLESRFAARHADGKALLVGRDQELALLMEHWRRARDGAGQLVLLSGEAGIGKSRIAEAVVDRLRGEPHYLLRYQCSPYHPDSALYPVIQQLIHAAGFVATDTTERRMERLETLLAESSDAAHTVAPLFAALLGIDGTARYGANTLTPQQRRSRTLAVLVEQLVGLARKKPVLWVFEDVHWIDPTTLELIELTLDRFQGTSVLALITARPSFVAPFANHPAVTRLTLNRLGRSATHAIVTGITHGKPLPNALFDEIVARTDGVPLFVEEMTKAVIESGILREERDAYHLDSPMSVLAIPATLHDSLVARLDRLQPLKEVAQIAAVIGRSFDHRSIAALSSLPEAELTDAMQRLVDAELIFRRGAPPEATYLFKHALVRDAAYASLLKVTRTSLHAKMAGILENQGGIAPELIAQHAEAAGLTEKALDYWERAGQQAQARPAYNEAATSFENAIRVCRALGDEVQWKRREQGIHIQLWQSLIAAQGYNAPATVSTAARALDLADEIGDVSLQVPAVFARWVGCYLDGRLWPEMACRLDELTKRMDESGPRLIALRVLALECFHQGRFKASLALAQRALADYDPVAHRNLALRFGHDPRTAAAGYEAWNLWYLGFPDQAAQISVDNLRWTRTLNHVNTTGLALSYGTAMPNIWLRRPKQVEKAARETLRIAEAMSMRFWAAWGRIHLGWAVSLLDGDGLGLMESGLREAEDVGRFQPMHLGMIADIYSRVGRHHEARLSMIKAFNALAAEGDVALASDLYRTRATVLLRADAGQRDAAITDLRRALEIATQQASPSLRLRAARDLAALLADCGERRQAADLLTPIYSWFTEGFDMPDLTEAKSLLDQLQ